MNVSMVSSVCLAVVCATTGGVVSASELSLDYFKGTALRDADMKGIPEKIDSILARAPEEFAFARGVAAFGALGGCRTIGGTPTEYSISILGDTHFDASPPSVYHGKWVPRTPNDRRDRQGEFKRNAEMWAGRLPRLIAAAAKTRRGDTAFLFQMGDLIQGDCTDYETRIRMFRDAQAACSKGFEPRGNSPHMGDEKLTARRFASGRVGLIALAAWNTVAIWYNAGNQRRA